MRDARWSETALVPQLSIQLPDTAFITTFTFARVPCSGFRWEFRIKCFSFKFKERFGVDCNLVELF